MLYGFSVVILQGSYVYDINGKKYLDSLAGLWCTALGMCSLPKFCKAVLKLTS